MHALGHRAGLCGPRARRCGSYSIACSSYSMEMRKCCYTELLPGTICLLSRSGLACKAWCWVSPASALPPYRHSRSQLYLAVEACAEV